MANFLIPTAIGLGANLLLSLLAPSGPPRQEGKLEDTGVPNAEYGFTLSYPFGRVRKDSLNMVWGLKLKEEKKTTGGKGGGTKTETFSYFLTAAYPIARQIGSVRRVWMNSNLVYGVDADDQRSAKFLEHCTIYTGNQTTPSSVIQSVESNPVPAFTGMSYLVFDNYPIAEYEGSGFPRVDVEIVGESGEEPKVKDILKKICNLAGLTDTQIDVSDIPDDRKLEGFDLLYDGTSFADQMKELMQAFFLVVRETKDKVVFRRQESNTVTFIPRSSLGAKKFGERPIDIDEKKLTHFREIPSAVTVSGLNVLKDHDSISVTAKDPSASHSNELSIQTRLISTDNLFITVASKILFLGRTQSKTYSKMFLLPAWDGLKAGDLISTDSDRNFHREVLQITKKTRGAGYLIEIEATRFQGYANDCRYTAVIDLYAYRNPIPGDATVDRIQRGAGLAASIEFHNPPMRVETTLPLGQKSTTTTTFKIYDVNENLIFTRNTGFGLAPNSAWGTVQNCNGVEEITSEIIADIEVNNEFAPPNEVPRGYGEAKAIVIDIPIVNSRDDDIGIYSAIEDVDSFTSGILVYSADGGANYEPAVTVTENTVGTVLSFSPNFNNASPYFIDELNWIRVRVDSGAELDPTTLENFLSGKSLGWFSTGEVIAFKDATIVSNNPPTFDLSYLTRGIKGTELSIPRHVTGERFVFLSDITRLPVELFDVNREVIFKVVPDGLTETEVEETTSHLITLEGLKPFPPVVMSERVGNDRVISWYRRTRINGRWVDYIDIPFAPGELDSYTVRVYDGAAVKREIIATGTRTATYSEADQIADWGSVQASYTIRVFQNSSYPVAFKEAPAIII